MSFENIALVHSGEDYFLRLHSIILKAQNEIHLQTYIFENDSTGVEIANALKEAALRNVMVYVLLDGYGSFKLTNSFFEDLVKNGVHIRYFSPWHSKNNLYIGRRLHHKVIVADGKIVLIGGINIANKYRGSSTVQPWLDYAVQIENEVIAESIEQLCRKIHLKKGKIKRNRIKTSFQSIGEASVRIIRNDWLKQKSEISNAYINAIRKADKEVIIVGSYFLPGRRLSNALKSATKRGVKVKIILSGVSDLPIVMRATQYLYPSFLKHRIELFEWKKSVLHGKLATTDNEWATLGSFNLNHLSSYASIEMNVEIKSVEFSKKLSQQLGEVVQQCDNITFETLKTRRGVFTKLINWLAYRLVRVALVIVTFIPFKRF